MEYKAAVESYTGKVREVTIGKGPKALKIGGENALPFHSFDEGSIPNPPRLALQVFDSPPEGWARWVLEPFQDVRLAGRDRACYGNRGRHVLAGRVPGKAVVGYARRVGRPAPGHRRPQPCVTQTGSTWNTRGPAR